MKLIYGILVMPYTISPNSCQLDAQNLSQHTVVNSLQPMLNLQPGLALWRRCKRRSSLGFSLKRCLAIMPLLLLPYASTTQALQSLSATTAQVINGSKPYLTFNNGITKVTTTDALLWISLSDGSTITPAINTSTASNPIVLPRTGERFTNINMLIPTYTNTIALSTVIDANNYWGDDDGDGEGSNGISITGNLSVRITNNDNQAVSRSDSLDICQAPYRVQLTSTSGSLTTQYGLPNSSNFSGSNVTYYISPNAPPKICYARPILQDGGEDGPAYIWKPNKGFIAQSGNSNFPTTGANKLYFDLDIGGIKGSTLTWPTVSQGGITATMTPTPSEPNNMRVTLTGPFASWSPGRLATPNLPQTFVLVGKDSGNREVLRYGFELRQWFVNHGDSQDTVADTLSWCNNLGAGYRLSRIKDLTNAVGSSWTGGSPASTGNYLQRNIGAGLFAEWGFLYDNRASGFDGYYYWTSDSNGSSPFYVYMWGGRVAVDSWYGLGYYGVCVYP